MKEEMQGFHMNPIAEIFIGEIALFSALSQSKDGAPGMHVRDFPEMSPTHLRS